MSRVSFIHSYSNIKRWAGRLLLSTVWATFGALGNLGVGGSAVAATPLSVAVGASIIKEFRDSKAAAENQASVKLESFRETGLNADSVVIAVDRDQAQVGLVGIDWAGLLNMMKERHFPDDSMQRLHHAQVGSLPVILVTYPGGPASLSDEQMAKIFSGQATNWKEISGEDLPIQLVVQGNSNALKKIFANRFLKGENIAARGLREITDPHQMSEFIARTKGAIGLGHTTLETAKLNQPKYSTLFHAVTIFYKSEAGDKADRYRDYFHDHPIK